MEEQGEGSRVVAVGAHVGVEYHVPAAVLERLIGRLAACRLRSARFYGVADDPRDERYRQQDYRREHEFIHRDIVVDAVAEDGEKYHSGQNPAEREQKIRQEAHPDRAEEEADEIYREYGQHADSEYRRELAFAVQLENSVAVFCLFELVYYIRPAEDNAEKIGGADLKENSDRIYRNGSQRGECHAHGDIYQRGGHDKDEGF